MSERLVSSDADCNQVAIFSVGTAQNGFYRISFGNSHGWLGRKCVDIGQEVFSGKYQADRAGVSTTGVLLHPGCSSRDLQLHARRSATIATALQAWPLGKARGHSGH
jgi:hypothetical protein